MTRYLWLAANAALTGVTILVYAATSAPKVVTVNHPVDRPVAVILPAGQATMAPESPRRRATLDDVRRDWKIEGQLDCNAERGNEAHFVDRPHAAHQWHPVETKLK